jgi:hypothetical protein
MTIAFSSGFATHIEAMLEWRTALGYSQDSRHGVIIREWSARDFDLRGGVRPVPGVVGWVVHQLLTTV